MDKPKPPASSLSRSIIRRIGLLSLLIIVGAIVAIILGLLLTLNRVDATMSEIKIEAASAFDLFFLKIQSDLLATSDGLAEHDDKNSALLALRIRNNAFLDVLFISPDGNILAQRNAVGRPTRMGVDESEWLTSPPPFGEVVIGPVRFEGQTPYVDMAVTATDAIGLPSGILLVRVDLTQLWNRTLDIQVGDTGYAYIVDDSGQLVAFRNRRLLENGSNLQNLVGHTPQEIAGSIFNFYTSMNNQPVLATAQHLKTVPWFAVVEQPVYEALAPFVPVGIAVFFVIAIVVFSLRNTLQFTRIRIALPLSNLRNAVTQMEDGHLGARVAIPYNDELGQLGHAFNLMAGEIQSQTESLIENEAKLSAIFNNSRDAIGVSKAGIHTLVNPAHAHMFGYESPDELIGVPIPDLIAPESRPVIIENIQGRAHGNDMPTLYEITAQRRDGTEFLMEVNVSTYEFKDQIYTVVNLRDITERKKADAALRESEKKYRSLFENMTSGFAVHKMIYDEQGNPYDYRYLEVNPAFEKLTGFPTTGMVGKTIRELMPDTEEYWIQVSGKVAKTGIPTSYMNFSQSLGKYYDTYLFSPEKDKFAVVFNDVTERVQAENALRTSEERLTLFMNSASDSFYILDSDLNFIEVNTKALELIGRKKEDVIGKNIADIVPDVKTSGRYEKHLEVIRTGEPFVIEDFIPHPVFGDKHFVLTSFKVGDGLGVITYDITERKMAESQLQEQLDELRRWHQVTVGREDRIISLKREINYLLEKDGKPPRYPSTDME